MIGFNNYHTMRQVSENTGLYPEQHNTIDSKKTLFHFLQKWHWFALSIITGLCLAFFFNTYMPLKYGIYSSITFDESVNGSKVNLSQNSNFDNSINVSEQNHAGRLKSFMLNQKTLENLGWKVTWYQKTLLFNKDLYGNEPFKISLLPEKLNITGIPVYITQVSDTEFEVKADAKYKQGSVSRDVFFTQKCKYGEPFENQYFGFVLEKSNKQVGAKSGLFFMVNNFNSLVLQYQNSLKVIPNEKQKYMIELMLSENNARRGVDYLNELAQFYVDYGLAEKNLVAENTIKFIDSQLKSVTDSLSYSEDRFVSFRTRTQAVDLNQEGGLAMQKKEALESEKAVIDGRLQYLRNLRNIMNDAKQMKQIVVPSIIGITDQTFNTMVVKLSDLYSRREVLSFSVQEKAPSLMLLDKEIQFTHNLLAQNINSLLSATEAELSNLMRRTGGFSSQLSLLPRTEQQFSTLKRKFDLNNDLYTFLLQKRAESAITYASNQPDVKILDKARLETVKLISPMIGVNYLIGLIFGFLVPFSFILLTDFFNSTIQSKEEVQEMTKLPVAGVIIHNLSKKDLVVLENPRSNITESFRLLRTNLKFILNGDNKKVIAVQSTIAGEGKSFISINLASVLAMNNLKVLLVGVDMRMSTLHKVLKSSNKKGLSTYLSQQDHFDDIIETTPITNLSYIPSGPVPPNPAELLENGYFGRLLEEAKSRFDYVILDSPPVSLVSDGIITGRHADVNLYVVRFRYSSREQFQFINEHEIKKTLPNLVLVLNDAVKENFRNGNYYNSRNKGYYGE